MSTMFSIPNISNSSNVKPYSIKAPDKDIEKSLLMTCKDKIPELDVCADICEDDRYKIRRLQRYDNPLFRFKLEKDSEFGNLYNLKGGINQWAKEVDSSISPY